MDGIPIRCMHRPDVGDRIGCPQVPKLSCRAIHISLATAMPRSVRISTSCTVIRGGRKTFVAPGRSATNSRCASMGGLKTFGIRTRSISELRVTKGALDPVTQVIFCDQSTKCSFRRRTSELHSESLCCICLNAREPHSDI